MENERWCWVYVSGECEASPWSSLLKDVEGALVQLSSDVPLSRNLCGGCGLGVEFSGDPRKRIKWNYIRGQG